MPDQERIYIGLTAILLLGVGGQWLASRLKLPAILVLLLSGLMIGPGTEWLTELGVLQGRWLNPNDLLGKLLLPIVSLSVALILFEGGLTLNIAELKEAGRSIRNLVSIGALVSWLLAALAGRYVAGLDWPIAWLLGAILVVTGPTVIGPLLRHVKPVGAVASILKWEGIVIDPVGAILATLVFEAIHIGAHVGSTEVVFISLVQIAKAVVVGSIAGLGAAAALVLLLRRYLVPDILHNAVALMLVIVAFTSSNLIQHESGLVTVTLMGIVLANQKQIPVRHILEFKESLSVLLIGSLFILLGSRLRLEQLQQLGWRSVAFLAVLVLVVRPATVVVSTVGSSLTWRQRAFLAWMAPRGIVAASVTSIFAIRLRDAGYPAADRLVPLTFCVIIGTVLIYGLTAKPLAGRLGLRPTGPTGILIAGANLLARTLGKGLREQGIEATLVDTNRNNVEAARSEGLPVLYASVGSRYVTEKMETGGIGQLLAVTPSEEVNSLAAIHFSRLFGRHSVFQLRSSSEGSSRKEKVPWEFRGRPLFRNDLTYAQLNERLLAGATITRVADSSQLPTELLSNGKILPLFVPAADGSLSVVTADTPFAPRPGQSVLALIDAGVTLEHSREPVAALSAS